MSRRTRWIGAAIVLLVVLALAFGVALLFRHPGAERERPPKAVIEAVDRYARAPASPLAANARSEIEHVYTPANDSLPSFFRVPAKRGGTCLVTSSAVIASCSTEGSPGTVTVMDDSEADDIPAFVFGQASRDVVAIVVEFAGTNKQAEIKDGFYLFQLPNPSLDDASVSAVTFKLANGRTRTIITS